MMVALSISPNEIAIAGALVALIVGVMIGRSFPRKRCQVKSELADTGLESPVAEPDEDDSDPTAPIVPMIEMARSPHDRHRDLAVGKGLVKQIDFLDSMATSAAKRKDDDLVKQLVLLKKEFVGMLKECAVEPFDYEANTPVTAEMRSRIQIVAGSTPSGERTRIVRTIRSGFCYLHGDEDTMIIRKAEVEIG